MELAKAKSMLEDILREISYPNSYAAVERFGGLRDVDAKIREVKMILGFLPGGAKQLVEEMDKDTDFGANSRRVRLETLANYCRTALKFINTGVVVQQKTIVKPPDFSRLTSTVPDLNLIIQSRWIEAQKCKHSGACLSAVIMMGSILEGLLLARASLSMAEAYTASRAPKTKEGKNVPIHDWNLNILIDVAVEKGWIKVDRGKFGHALRDSRNIVHPWAHMSTRADFDQATCETCWTVLGASVEDLFNSLS